MKTEEIAALIFVFCTLFGVYHVSKINSKFLLYLFVWLILQAFLAYIGFYKVNQMPPRFILVIAPAFLFLLFLFLNPKTRRFLNNLTIRQLHQIHLVRIPIEIVLYLLYLSAEIPKMMTFEGRNFDILIGISSFFVVRFGIDQKILGKPQVILWNLVGLLMVLNILFIGVFSVESPIQQLNFDSPNKAVLDFPFIWLPAFLVPLVIFAHVQSLLLLLKHK